jgi:methylmalonyl-CoA mutase
VIPTELIRSTDEAKNRQISNLRAVQDRNSEVSDQTLRDLQAAAVGGENLFAQLMETSKTASLGQMSNALYAVGGQYRRNM